MTNTTRKPTKNEILEIIDTYEGLIKQDFSNVELRNRRTHWLGELNKLESK